jgi:hypothetical protein
MRRCRGWLWRKREEDGGERDDVRLAKVSENLPFDRFSEKLFDASFWKPDARVRVRVGWCVVHVVCLQARVWIGYSKKRCVCVMRWGVMVRLVIIVAWFLTTAVYKVQFWTTPEQREEDSEKDDDAGEVALALPGKPGPEERQPLRITIIQFLPQWRLVWTRQMKIFSASVCPPHLGRLWLRAPFGQLERIWRARPAPGAPLGLD